MWKDEALDNWFQQFADGEIEGRVMSWMTGAQRHGWRVMHEEGLFHKRMEERRIRTTTQSHDLVMRYEEVDVDVCISQVETLLTPSLR